MHIPEGRVGISEGRKKTAIFYTVIALIIIVIAGVIWVVQAVRYSMHEKTIAVVTNYDISDSKNVWTEFTYTYKGETYVLILPEHSAEMEIDSSVELMVNTLSPEKAFVLPTIPYMWALIALQIGIVLAIVAGGNWAKYWKYSMLEKL